MDTNLLRILNLPVFNNSEEFANLVHIDSAILERILSNIESHYSSFEIDKRGGKKRKIYAPNITLKAIQSWILRNILDKLSPSQFATAYILDKNIYENVYPHRNNRFFICIDISDFFPSISHRRVKKIFDLIGYSQITSAILTRLCTYKNHIPQGAITSPALSNLTASWLDRRIAGFTSRRNIIYTRYSDDITLSSNNRKELNKSLVIIKEIINSEGFKINNSKTRIMGPKMSCRITGFVKNNSQPKFSIGRKKKRYLRSVMFRLANNLEVESKYAHSDSIAGWLNFLKSVDKKSYSQMSKYWEKLNS